jgi:hypothetical protein
LKKIDAFEGVKKATPVRQIPEMMNTIGKVIKYDS